MPRSFSKKVTLILALSFLAAFAVGCASSSSDDDDSGGSNSQAQENCDKIAQCGFGGDLGITSVSQCVDYLNGLSADTQTCASDASNCTELAACFGISGEDDDAADDATDDTGDDSGDDDVGEPPQLEGNAFMITAADPDFSDIGWGEWTGGTFDPEWEIAAWWTGWRDTDNNLKGGKQYVILDDGEPIESDLPPSMLSLGTFDLRSIGLELTGDFATEGDHHVELWVEDQSGNESNHANFYYTAGEGDYTLGQPFTDFTLRGFQKTIVKDSTGTFADYHLADYAGKVVMLDSFAGWCPPCNAEAPELDVLRGDYSVDDLAIFSLMQEDFNGATVADETLENWTLYEYGDPTDDLRDEQLTGIILNDDNATVAGPWYPANYVPTNFVLDKNHIIRFKMSGWYKPYIKQVIDALLEE